MRRLIPSAQVLAWLVALVAGSAWASLAMAQTRAEPPAAGAVFSVAATRGAGGDLTVIWTAAPGTYLYRDSLGARVDGHAAALALPPGTEKDDPNFGRVEVYHGYVDGTVRDAPARGRLVVTLQGCADEGICYPPLARAIDLATLAVSDVPADPLSTRAAAPAVGDAAGSAAAEVAPAAAPAAVPAVAPVAAPASEGSIWSDPAALLRGGLGPMLLAFLGFGVLLSLTPCVFPMIPILSGLLARSGEGLSARRGVALSASYVLAMALAYGLLGLVAGWSGANLQAALQTPWALGLAAAVFVALALSMFGLFELQVPPALAARLAGGHAGPGGSLVGAAVLGFGSALVVGPCVTPPLAAALLYAAGSGAALTGAAALFMLGLGMGLPLIAVGLFGARVLPKSGPWLARVKQVFGVVFLVVAVSLVTRLLPGPQTLALWGALALGLAVFLGGFDHLTAASGWRPRLGKAAGLVSAVYGVALVLGASGGAQDPLRPLAFLSSGAGPEVPTAELRVTSLEGLKEALKANAGDRPALVTFTAAWCTVCKSNEAVMAEPAVRQQLAGVPIIAADITTYDAAAKALMDRYAVVGPPTVVLLDAAGREVPGSRITGPLTAEDITRRLGAGA